MDYKICTKCGKTKNIDDFTNKKNGKYCWCRECLYLFQRNRWKDRKRKAIELMGNQQFPLNLQISTNT